MKRFLCAGEGCDHVKILKSRCFNSVFFKKHSAIIYLTLIFLIHSVNAQENPTNIYSVSAAQRVPESFWTHSFQYYENGVVQTKTLKEFQGKAILLDFWSVYCGACVQAFPSLKNIQKKYNDELFIILVNSMPKEGKEELDALFTRMGNNFNLPSIIYDTFFQRLFPHGPIPHYVWISKDGRVDAITRKTYFNEENVKIFLRKNEQN